jgi:hypothetical protein
MKMIGTQFWKRFGLAALLLVALPAALRAQQWEISPYAGGFFPSDTLGGEDFKDDGLWGVRAGGFVSERMFVDGNLGYVHQFEYTGSDPGSHAWIWDANATLHFFPWDANLSPFVTAGIGGLTATLDDGGSILFLYADDGGFLEVGDPEPGLRVVQLDDGDTFLGLNYGGGLKANRLVGPLGLRFDLRGRTLPNFFGEDLSWLEAAGGITLSWGER